MIKTEVFTAGLMCEYRATSICTTTELELVLDQFSVNGGLCKSFVREVRVIQAASARLETGRRAL